MSPATGPKISSRITTEVGRRIEQQLRRQVGRAGLALRKCALVDHRPRAGGDRCLNLRADRIGGAGAHHRAEGGFRVERIAEAVLLHERSSSPWQIRS